MRFKQKRRIFMRLFDLKTDESFWLFLLSSDPAGIRTQDPNIKSVMLYQLSYGIRLLTFRYCYRFRLK
jgi:hypothetical protein